MLNPDCWRAGYTEADREKEVFSILYSLLYHLPDSPGALGRRWRLFALFICGASHLHIALALAGEGAQLGGAGASFCAALDKELAK